MPSIMNQKTEDYLSGRLSGAELEEFELHIQSDPEALRELLEDQRFLAALKEYGENKRLRKMIRRVGNLHAVSVKETPVLSLIKRNWKPISAAASLALVIGISGLLFFNTKNASETQTANFRALKKELDQLQRSQHNLLNDLKDLDNQKSTPAPANYSGTGFALSSDGIFVTSLHLVDKSDSVFIVNNKKERFKAIPVYRDRQTDIAILKIEDPNFVPYPNLPYTFNNRDLNLGENVFTLGYPREDVVFGEGSLSAKTGFRGDTTSCQVSIPVNPGNSGGPLVDEKGHVIGIISGKQTETEGTAFAVKSSCLINILESLSKDSLHSGIKLPTKNQLSSMSRTKQVKAMEDYVVVIKVYNAN